MRCILKSQFSVTWSMLQSKPWSPVSVTTNPWPLVEKVSSWQICIKHYWISNPREQHLTKLRYSHAFSSLQHSFRMKIMKSYTCHVERLWLVVMERKLWHQHLSHAKARHQKTEEEKQMPYWTACHCDKHQGYHLCKVIYSPEIFVRCTFPIRKCPTNSQNTSQRVVIPPGAPPPGQNGEHQGHAKNHANPLRCNRPNASKCPVQTNEDILHQRYDMIWHVVYLKQRHRSHSLLCNPENRFKSYIDLRVWLPHPSS